MLFITIIFKKKNNLILTDALKENRKDPFKVLEYIANTIDHEECVADGLAALSDIIREDELVHKCIDTKARNLISLAMWDNIFNKDVQISGCYILSNLVVYCKKIIYNLNYFFVFFHSLIVANAFFFLPKAFYNSIALSFP